MKTLGRANRVARIGSRDHDLGICLILAGKELFKIVDQTHIKD